MNQKNFMKNVKKFNADNLKKSIKKELREDKDYDFNEERIDQIKVSYNIAGIFAEWFISQLNFSEILGQVEPMRNEIKSLEARSVKVMRELTSGEKELEELQVLVKQLKEDYNFIISQVEKIKKEMVTVEKRVEVSKNLFSNLSSEKNRWTKSSQEFKRKMQQMTGNVLLCAAFLAYCGFFDQQYRNLLLKTWKGMLAESGLVFFDKLIIHKYLARGFEQQEWKSHHLPDDDLCIQNAIIIKRHNRYPLIIDPSEQATRFILSYYKSRKIEQTNYKAANFIKVLEKCLRFGLPILVHNVETMEPLMNSILNREVYKQGGRVLVRVGDQEIDYNSNFEMIMVTINPNAKFSPDLCSRVTFVNFTVTQSSLQNQCINIYLKNERPDTEKQRLNLLKLQGEYMVQLRMLEDDLLKKIGSQKGQILENIQLIKSLDLLKKNADVITKKMNDSEQVFLQVKQVSDQYLTLSQISSKLYFILQRLGNQNPFYQFNFQFYMQIITKLLKGNKNLDAIPREEHQKRIEQIQNDLFLYTYRKIYYSIFEKDKDLICLLLLQLRLGDQHAHSFRTLFQSPTNLKVDLDSEFKAVLGQRQLLKLQNLIQQDWCPNLKAQIRSNPGRWVKWIGDDSQQDMDVE